MRKLTLILLAMILAVLPFACAGASVLTVDEKNEEAGYRLVVQDDAGLIDRADMQSVVDSMRGITEYAGVGFLTVPAGESAHNSATRAQQWGDSMFGSDTRFTVFIIDMTNRHLDIYASRPLSGVLTAAEENSIADNVYKSASYGNYDKCAIDAFTQIHKVLKGEKIATPMKYISNALLALIAAILAAYLLISGWARKEQAVSMPAVVKGAAAGAATVVLANHLKKVVHHESSSGGHGGGGFGGGGGGGGGSSGGHGF